MVQGKGFGYLYPLLHDAHFRHPGTSGYLPMEAPCEQEVLMTLMHQRGADAPARAWHVLSPVQRAAV